MQTAIIGAGAMGCLFGAMLAGAAPVVLVDPWQEHVAAINAKGLTVEGLDGRQRVHRLPVFNDPAAIEQPVDLAIIFTKSYRTEAAAGDANRILKPDGLVLTLQNGIGNLETIARVVGPQRAVAGVTAHGGTLLGPGRVRHAGVGPTHIARPATAAQAVDRICRFFVRAGIDTTAEENLDRLIWGKLVINVGINALAAILRVTNGAIGDTPACEPLVAGAVAEAVAVAHALGIRLPYKDPLQRVKAVCQATAANRASMLQDILRGARTEIGVINRAIVERGATLGIATPSNRLLAEIVEALEATAAHRVG